MIVALYSYIKEKLQQMINVITMFYKIIFKNFYDIASVHAKFGTK